MLILGIVICVFFLPQLKATSYDMIITLTSDALWEYYNDNPIICEPNLILHITEPSGEVANWWNKTTLIGGEIVYDRENQQYVLESAKDGRYYIEVERKQFQENTQCQVTVLLWEGMSEETIIAYGTFELYEEIQQVGCFQMPEGVEVEAGGAGGGCFIATATYGSPMAEEVRVLSRFRDKYLNKSVVRMYYKISPPIAKIIAKSLILRAIVRIYLKPYIMLMEFIGKSHEQRKG